MRIKDQRREGGLLAWLLNSESVSTACLRLHSSHTLIDLLPYLFEYGGSIGCTFLWSSSHGFCVFEQAYRVKSSSSSLFWRVCLGWAMFAQLGSDWSRRLMSSSLDQEALMVSFSSHWTMALMTRGHTRGIIKVLKQCWLKAYACVFALTRQREHIGAATFRKCDTLFVWIGVKSEIKSNQKQPLRMKIICTEHGSTTDIVLIPWTGGTSPLGFHIHTNTNTHIHIGSLCGACLYHSEAPVRPRLTCDKVQMDSRRSVTPFLHLLANSSLPISHPSSPPPPPAAFTWPGVPYSRRAQMDGLSQHPCER